MVGQRQKQPAFWAVSSDCWRCCCCLRSPKWWTANGGAKRRSLLASFERPKKVSCGRGFGLSSFVSVARVATDNISREASAPSPCVELGILVLNLKVLVYWATLLRPPGCSRRCGPFLNVVRRGRPKSVRVWVKNFLQFVAFCRSGFVNQRKAPASSALGKNNRHRAW